jgi:polyvinyl alcohol dehydrogenase (cytochrome)
MLLGTLAVGSASSACTTPEAPLDTYTLGWGIDLGNSRYQPNTVLRSANIAGLRLEWVYGLSSVAPRAYPLITADTIFVGDDGRGLVALDRQTGCQRWRYRHEGQISTAAVPATVRGRPALLFGDRRSGIYMVDARSGELVWHAEVHEDPLPWYSGTPQIVGQRVLVPISSFEVALAINPLYGCCTTSGGLAAFDLETGDELWYLPTIAEAPQETGRHWGFVSKYGPSGATVWATPSYDPETETVYFGTGQNYSHPTTDTSDAIFAVDVTTGEVRWHKQFTANDAYTAACNVVALNHPNCPKPLGPDVDFGAATMLVRTPSGRSLLMAGQKSADVYALEPATGEVVWHRKLGRGGIIGGVHWGMATNPSLGLLFVPISDKEVAGFPSPGLPAPGLYALDVESGETRWHHAAPSWCAETACAYGLSAAPIAASDLVIVGSIDGYLRALDARSGEVLWTFDAWRDFDTVDGGRASGGAFDAHGAMVAGDVMVISSGYRYVGQQRGGNALLTFRLDDNDGG